jgi:hypothetical protein
MGVCMLSPPAHPDSLPSVQSEFLVAPLHTSLRMCLPELHVLMGGSAEFMRVAPVDLALVLSRAAVVDHGTHVYIWLASSDDTSSRNSKSSSSSDEAAMEQFCMQFALQLINGRIPVPECKVVRQVSEEMGQGGGSHILF